MSKNEEKQSVANNPSGWAEKMHQSWCWPGTAIRFHSLQTLEDVGSREARWNQTIRPMRNRLLQQPAEDFVPNRYHVRASAVSFHRTIPAGHMSGASALTFSSRAQPIIANRNAGLGWQTHILSLPPTARLVSGVSPVMGFLDPLLRAC